MKAFPLPARRPLPAALTSPARSLRRTVWFSGGALLSTLIFMATQAAAQQPAKKGEFSVQRFDPAPGPRNYFTTRGVRTDGKMAWSAGLFVNYAYKPFVVESCQSQTNCKDPNAIQQQNVKVVENMVTADVLGSFTPIPRLQIGLKVPVTFDKGQGLTDTGTADPNGLSGTGLGDMELEGKFRIHGKIRDPFVVGAGAFVTGPFGHLTSKGNYIGDSTPTAGLRAIFDGEHGPFSVGGNLAGVYRGTGRVGSTELGPEFRYGIGAGFKVSPVFRLLLDDFGSTKFSSHNGTNANEIDGGMRIMPLHSPIVVNLGAGTGLVQGVGVPAVRAFVGFMYVQERKDTDHDGIYDNEDQCPTKAEDYDGYQDSDGCPDPDNDGDTIPDKLDKCPNQAEDFDGFQDTDGCPDPDNDHDGIPDDHDKCPNKPETKNGYQDSDGCPDVPDSDHDGVPDSKDQCPHQAEDTDGFMDTDGCPDPDNDNDGIPDTRDQCDGQKETWNGYQDDDGCPDTPPKGFKPPKNWKKPKLCPPDSPPGREVCYRPPAATAPKGKPKGKKKK